MADAVLVPTVVLSDQQADFAREYVRDLSAQGAAKRVGVHKDTARRWLARQDVQLEIARRAEMRLANESYAKDLVVRRLTDIADCDIRDICNPDGSFKSLNEMPETAARAIESFEAVEIEDSGHRIIKVKLTSRHRSLELLARHFGMLVDRLQVNVTQSLLPPDKLALLDNDELQEVQAMAVRIQSIVRAAEARAGKAAA